MRVKSVFEELSEAVAKSNYSGKKQKRAEISSVKVAKCKEIPPAKLESPRGQEEKRVIPGASPRKNGKLRDISMRKLSFQHRYFFAYRLFALSPLPPIYPIFRLHEPGTRPFSLLCPKCGATDNFFFQALEVGDNSGGDLLVICGYCESKLIPDKHYAGTAREIYDKLLPVKEDPLEGQDPAHPVIKPCPVCGVCVFWENLNGVVSCVKCCSPYNKWAVLRYWKVTEGEQVMEVEYEHNYEKAKEELFRHARRGGRWQVGSLQYKLLNLIPWEYGRDTPPGEAEFNSIWQAVCELFPQEKQRIPALNIFRRKLKNDTFNNTPFRQAVITKLMEKAKVPVIESGENPF